ncbi:hypothetical protein GLYMA_05G247350v4 [Glycine max]|nr:hypothetical protein GLYMA_05G247350v4 [Glycine max]KAH1079886.1 hypothetical protein GYH30_057021 [Glycine max]
MVALRLLPICLILLFKCDWKMYLNYESNKRA